MSMDFHKVNVGGRWPWPARRNSPRAIVGRGVIAAFAAPREAARLRRVCDSEPYRVCLNREPRRRVRDQAGFKRRDTFSLGDSQFPVVSVGGN